MWAQALAAAIGLWLYAAPGVLGYGDPAATSDRIVGPLVLSFSFVAMWEFVRGLRLANRPLALWLLAAPLVLGYPTDALVSGMLSGAAVLGLSFVRGKVEGRYGGGWAAVFRRDGNRAGPPPPRSLRD